MLDGMNNGSTWALAIVATGWAACWGILGCTDDGGGGDDEVGSESGTDEATGTGTDDTDTETGTDTDDTGGEALGCEHAGYEAAPWSDVGTEFAFGEVVPDFTVETLRGPLTLSEIWDDCLVVTLVPYSAVFSNHDVAELIAGSEPNNVYLFFSWSPDPTADVGQIAQKVEAYLEGQGPEVYDEWSQRFRYVTEPAAGVPLFAATNGVDSQYFLIDSRQRLRDAGSYNTFNGDFNPYLPMVKYAAAWFNYERRLEDKLAAQADDGDVLIVPWVTEGYEQTDEGRLAIELPPAEDMARFDRVEIVVKEVCLPGSRFPVHFGVCPAWDVGHKITLCASEDACTSDEHDQLYRYITGYHSGVWLYEDVSHGLPWFKQGGTRWLRTNRGDFYGSIEFHFFDDGEVEASSHVGDARHMIGLGTAPFDAAHNDSFPNYTFTPPPGTVRVMLDARVQGGGNQDGNGCAEFCSHSHAIDLNGQVFEHTFVMNQSSFDCAERAGEGVTAGQFGTWFFDRGSWCPGGPVERWQVDVTEAVDLDGSNEVVWTGSFNGDPWPPGGGLTATAWLVFYGADGEAIVEAQPSPACPNPPTVTIRDFSREHPDFEPIQQAWEALDDGDAAKENARGELTGVVAQTLVEVDGEWKPQLIWPENTLPYTTAASFDAWWTDSPDSFTTTAPEGAFVRTRQDTAGYLRSNGPTYAASPLLDGEFGHGSEDMTFNVEGVPTPVNTTYTVEVAGAFAYTPGVRLRLGSKADLFVFVDHQLVLESGGYLGKGFPRHILELDEVAAELGLVEGQSYDLHVFAVASRGSSANPHIWLEHPGCD